MAGILEMSQVGFSTNVWLASSVGDKFSNYTTLL